MEMEYQKRFDTHGMTQRPDILVHSPRTDESAPAVKRGNLAVYALKKHATTEDSHDDHRKLQEIVAELRYQVGFFVNIAGTRASLGVWKHLVSSNIQAFGTRLVGEEVEIDHWWYDRSKAIARFETLGPLDSTQSLSRP